MKNPVIDKTMAVRIATQLGWEPKREWTDLLGAEVKTIRDSAKTLDEAIYMAEAKLREKNA